ncbi:helix-turn-helix domain-containing protein [Thiomicrorhabdus lithotrophica]|uniref:Helix-turn-helix domain-containing protein n=1 Tax=Thiomicrorhabdus lithotrophica TaxID=2949997 RepID=A0ABY8C890_9GAMM|nr:helix-turn-helix transcriptional regulator [Thiomicrorhabdus lithotrophica]WEJ62174.1 helix-turn-helix domain-containing protein [Thiomicrorhabdus lithotrophica]
MKTITDRINEIIADSGLNQSEVARKVGTTPQAIRKWQSGESTGIKGENLINLARLGNTTMEWIQTGKEPTKTNEPQAEYNSDPFQALSPTSQAITGLIQEYEDQGIVIPKEILEEFKAYLKIRLSGLVANNQQKNTVSNRIKELANGSKKP